MLPKLSALFTNLQRDAARYRQDWYRKGGFWIGATYRVGSAARELPVPLRIPVQVPYRAMNFFWRAVFNVHISDRAKIGGGLWLVHATNVLIPATEIGENATIFHDVTIGTNLHPDRYPRIGNGVEIYVGARVLGGVEIGDDARIGANCVVTTDVRPGAIVVPAANRVIRSPSPSHLDRLRQAWCSSEIPAPEQSLASAPPS